MLWTGNAIEAPQFLATEVEARLKQGNSNPFAMELISPTAVAGLISVRRRGAASGLWRAPCAGENEVDFREQGIRSQNFRSQHIAAEGVAD